MSRRVTDKDIEQLLAALEDGNILRMAWKMTVKMKKPFLRMQEK